MWVELFILMVWAVGKARTCDLCPDRGEKKTIYFEIISMYLISFSSSDLRLSF